jgi:hypothetical protein
MLVFKITTVDPNRTDSQDLLGLLIAVTDQAYFLIDPRYMLDEPIILAHASKKEKLPYFHFDNFKESPWTLTIDPASVTPDKISGTWSNKETGPAMDDDTWVATGSGIGVPDGDEARAASAK